MILLPIAEFPYLPYPALTAGDPALSPLKEPRNQPVRHLVGVPLPVLAVLAAAAVLVTDAAVNQQDGHVNDVKVRENMTEATGGAVGQRSHQIASVVEVARHSPET